MPRVLQPEALEWSQVHVHYRPVTSVATRATSPRVLETAQLGAQNFADSFQMPYFYSSTVLLNVKAYVQHLKKAIFINRL